MGAHGRPVEIPQWWMDALGAAMQAKGIGRPEIARWVIEARLVSGDTADKIATGARVKVHRFFKDGPTTADMVDLLRDKLGLPRFEFIAATARQAEAMELASRDPDGLARTLAAGSLVISLESGEHSLDELISRQTGSVDSSPDGDVRRRSRGAGPVPKAARGVGRRA